MCELGPGEVFDQGAFEGFAVEGDFVIGYFGNLDLDFEGGWG